MLCVCDISMQHFLKVDLCLPLSREAAEIAGLESKVFIGVQWAQRVCSHGHAL